MLLDTPSAALGQIAPAFTLKDPNGQTHSLESLIGKNGLLIAFICNHCPYVKAIIDRLADDAKALQSEGIQVVAIMPNDYQSYSDDSPEKMQAFASKHNFSFPYLVDETQSVAKAYGAVCTPDFFGYNASKELQYRGRLDNLTMNSTETERIPELLNAMREIAKTGQGPKDQMPSMGCSIKWRA